MSINIDSKYVEKGAIELANLENIDAFESPNEHWARYPEHVKNTYRMKAAAVLDGVDFETVNYKAWKYDGLG